MANVSQKLKDLLSRDVPTAVLTGAGVSAECGIPTFRGEDGLWKKFKPQELANVDAFLRNPELVWSWYQHRREIINNVEPNPGHIALAQLERKLTNFTLITQNIDGLHRRAGSENILELHGNIQRNKCIKCGRFCEEPVDEKSESVPNCECGGKIRPDVVWFGEMLPQNVIQEAYRATERSALFFSIGTSALVQPAASLPLLAQHRGAYLVEINIEPTVLTDLTDEHFMGKFGEIFPRIIEECGLE